jgi:hypothetical protein
VSKQAFNAGEMMQEQTTEQIGEERQKLEKQKMGCDHVASSRVLGWQQLQQCSVCLAVVHVGWARHHRLL